MDRVFLYSGEEGFVLCFKELCVFDRGEQNQNGKDVDRIDQWEESNTLLLGIEKRGKG